MIQGITKAEQQCSAFFLKLKNEYIFFYIPYWNLSFAGYF